MERILLIDDDKDLVEVLTADLENIGYEVLPAYDGQEGLKKAQEEKPGLIILDLILPKIDGFKVCQMLKSDDKYQQIPIIMLTARGKGLDLERIVAEELGANAYITKPFEPQVLVSKIQELLKK